MEVSQLAVTAVRYCATTCGYLFLCWGSCLVLVLWFLFFLVLRAG